MSVLSALDTLGIDYVVRGDEAFARCPAHRELHPSWSINIESSRHRCFACPFRGNLVTLAAFMYGLKYDQAQFWSRRYVHVSQTTHSRVLVPHSSSPAYLSEAELALFVPPPPHALAARKISAEAAQVYGILWNNKTHSWILPIRCAKTHNLLGWQEKGADVRNVPYGIRKSETLFGLRAFEYGSRAILVESPIDVGVLHSAGIRGGLALYGVSLSTTQLTTLRSRAARIIFALDDDTSGRKATAQLSRLFPRRHIGFFDYTVAPGCKDIGECSYEQIRSGLHEVRRYL